MSESQMPEKPQGCGCGKANVTTNVTHAQKSAITEQQKNLIERIKRSSQRKNSIYKTKTRIFL